MSPDQIFEQSAAATRSVLEQVTADQLDLQSPCAAWDVRGVINHVIDGQGFFQAMINGDPPTASGDDHASGDYLAAYDAAVAASTAAFQAEGAMGKMITAPWGAEMPGAGVAGMASNDTFAHGWDIAKATGQSTDIAPQLAEGLLGASQHMIQDAFRGPEGAPFGVAQEAPEGANAADRLAAFLGRQV